MSSVTNAQRFVAALVTPLQDLETLWHQTRLMRDLNTSVGVHLTTLGKIVGKQREGVSDDEVFRRLARAQIVVNNSSGSIDELIQIAELVVFDDDADYVIENTGVAALYLRVEGISMSMELALTLLRLLRRAVLGGVRIVLQWFPEGVDEDTAFQFDGDTEDTAFPDTNGIGGGMLIDSME